PQVAVAVVVGRHERRDIPEVGPVGDGERQVGPDRTAGDGHGQDRRRPERKSPGRGRRKGTRLLAHVHLAKHPEGWESFCRDALAERLRRWAVRLDGSALRDRYWLAALRTFDALAGQRRPGLERLAAAGTPEGHGGRDGLAVGPPVPKTPGQQSVRGPEHQ